MSFLGRVQNANNFDVIAKRTVEDKVVFKAFYKPHAQAVKFWVHIYVPGSDQRPFAQSVKRFKNSLVEQECFFHACSGNENAVGIYICLSFRQ